MYAKNLEKRHIEQLFSIYEDTLSDEGIKNIFLQLQFILYF